MSEASGRAARFNVLAATVLGKSAQLISFVLAARLVSIDEFGVFASSLAVGTIGGAIAAFGVQEAAVRLRVIRPDLGDRVRWHAIALSAVLGLAAAALVLAGASFMDRGLSARVGYAPEPAAAIALLLPLQQTTTHWLRGIDRPRSFAVAEHLARPVVFLVGVLATMLGLGTAGAEWLLHSWVVANLVTIVTALTLSVSTSQAPPGVAGGGLTIELLRGGASVWVAMLAGLLLGQFEVAALGARGMAAESAGFRAAFQFAVISLVPLHASNAILGPRVAEAYALGDRTGYLTREFHRWAMLWGFPPLVMVMVAPSQVLSMALGDEFFPYGSVLRVLAGAVAVNLASGPTGTVLFACGRNRILLGSSAAAALAHAGGVVVLSSHGAFALAQLHLVITAGLFGAQATVVRRILGPATYDGWIRSVVPPLVATALGTASISVLNLAPAMAAVVAGAITWLWLIRRPDAVIKHNLL